MKMGLKMKGENRILKSDMNRLRPEFVAGISSVAFSTITLLLYIPSVLLLGNASDFLVGFIEVIPFILMVSAVCFFVLLGVIMLLKGRVRKMMIAIVFGISLAMYIQSNFLNAQLPRLDGSEVEWSKFSNAGFTSALTWIFILLIILSMAAFKEKLFYKLVMFGGAVLCVMQLASFFVLLFFSPSDNSGKEYVVSKKDEFLFSSHHNICVFVVDTLDAAWAEEFIINNNSYADYLQDFTYFDNVVCNGAPTILGMPNMLTGEIYDPDESIHDYYHEAYTSSTLFRDLDKNNYMINVYTSPEYIRYADYELLNNVFEGKYYITDRPDFIKLLYKMVAYNVVPWQLKKHFYLYTEDFNQYVSFKESEHQAFVLSKDAELYNDFQSHGIGVENNKNVFSLYHMMGAHLPYTLSSQGTEVPQSTLGDQIHGCFKIIGDIISELKEKNLYDNTTIIITADHGGVDIYQNPAVLVKCSGVNKEFSTDSTPLTFRNLRATFVSEFLDGYQTIYGYDLFSCPEEENTNREITIDSVLEKNIASNSGGAAKPYTTYIVGNPARDVSQLRKKNNEELFYLPGEMIHLCGDEASELVRLDGFSGWEENNRWTDGKQASIMIPVRDEDITNDTYVLELAFHTFHEQRVIISAGDVLLESFTHNGETIKQFDIPKSCFDNNSIVISFELSDATSSESDARELGISVTALRLFPKSES